MTFPGKLTDTQEQPETEPQSVPGLGHASDNDAPLESASDTISSINSSVESRERQTTIAVSKPEATPKERSLPSAGPSGTAAHSSPSPEPVSPQVKADRAGSTVSPPAVEPVIPFNNPRCKHPDACHLAHSRKDECFDCRMAFAQLPKDEQIRLWQEAEDAARECEVTA